MGMDVYGKKPRNKKGEYFRNNVWHWRPLWDYCLHVAPVAHKVKSGHSNDGDGLDAEDARYLADCLRGEISSGRCAQYEAQYQRMQDLLPDVPCDICAGTGKRLKPPEVGAGLTPCNGCDSKGTVRPFNAHYPFSVKNVAEFVEFLENCGGFEIC